MEKEKYLYEKHQNATLTINQLDGWRNGWMETQRQAMETKRSPLFSTLNIGEELRLFMAGAKGILQMSCSVLAQALISGMDEHGRLPSFHVQCGHRLRIEMLRIVAGRIKMSCSDYLMLLDNPPDHWHADDSLEVLQKLTVVSATCSTCQCPIENQDGDEPSHHAKNHSDNSGNNDDAEDDYGEVLPAERKAKLTQLFKSNKELAGSRTRNAITPRIR
ncbi:hypothetical protein DEU56DRAFT_761857 [Suillus clintonianus]|uniref:uncharacterized protein n=1 Tax=Suillus clintonianus TaxID=1904413 RepID=UPI001B878B10|nr:uncharacterized protein DEU56DRAFT_761857 [Suillus clintonianus]KAG2114402.1 hypothetical protein DEU56DRAFT_761857 [Suillus clintonianus]